MSPKLQPMAVQYYCHVPPSVSHCQCMHYYWREFWSHDTDVYLTYIRFGIILAQFYVNFLRKEHQIDVFQVAFNS